MNGRIYTCGEMQRSPRTCTREHGHHGACVSESGLRYVRPEITHKDGCAGCEPEWIATEARNRRLYPQRFRS